MCGALEGTEAVRVQETRFALLAYFGIERCFEALRDECGTGKEKQGAKLLREVEEEEEGRLRRLAAIREESALPMRTLLTPHCWHWPNGGRDSILVPAMLALMTKMHWQRKRVV